jgi:hypothetical protein
LRGIFSIVGPQIASSGSLFRNLSKVERYLWLGEKWSALLTAASQEGVPEMCLGVVSFQLVKSFTMGRTEANVNPPTAVPEIAGADT